MSIASTEWTYITDAHKCTTKCITDKCMAWKWKDNRETDREIELKHGKGYCRRFK